MEYNRQIGLWLFAVIFLIVILVIFGGWVRLTRSGLSMVEWKVVRGVVPPLNAAAWDETFAKYRHTPEYQKVNRGMTLEEFKYIYYREYGHRILGRLAGLAFVVPLFVFLVRGALPRRRIPAFLGIGILFAVQGVMGWFMVKSGLVDQPQVSHYRLTLHLLCALALLGACLWLGFKYSFAVPPTGAPLSASPFFKKLALVFTGAVCLQITAGALTAGLKAGHISATFPTMFGQWIPTGLGRLQPWIMNALENPVLVHFQHRWFGFVVAGLALALLVRVRREPALPHLRAGVRGVLHLILLQIALGIGVIVLHVPVWLASVHQAVALGIFGLALFICYRAFGSRP